MLGVCVVKAVGNPAAAGRGEIEGRGSSEGVTSTVGADIVGEDAGATTTAGAFETIVDGAPPSLVGIPLVDDVGLDADKDGLAVERTVGNNISDGFGVPNSTGDG